MRVIRDHLEFQAGHVPEKDGLSPAVALACRAKVNPDTLDSLLRGRGDTVDFDIADRLLCAAGLSPNVWQEELLDIYLEVDLSGPSRVALWEPEFEERVCVECEGTFTIITNLKSMGRSEGKCCSSQCAAALGGRAKGRKKELVGAA